MDLPERIGTYRVLRLLGEGGMGRVYACLDEALEREVAVKVLLPAVQALPDVSERFLREARAMAKLSSPNVVTLHAVGSTPEGPYLVMELMEGQDVAAGLAGGPYPIAEAIDIVRQAARGLKAASDAGLVHRDVKPENLFRSGDVVKVADFGLARPVDGSANITQAGLLIGTPHYMAPELAKGHPPSIQSDLYALGATLFELLSGATPYRGDGAIEIVSAHVTAPVPQLQDEASNVPLAVSQLIERLMQKAPEARFATYDEFLLALDDAEAGKSPHLASSGASSPRGAKAPAPTVNLSARRQRAAPLAAGVGALLIAAAVVVLIASGDDDAGPETDAADAPDDDDDDEDDTERLKRAAVSERWSTRREALKTLKEQDVDISDIEEAVGILDLQQGRTCESRDFGLKRLDRVGHTTKALRAVQHAKTKPIDNACMAIDLWSAESKIKRRIRESKSR